MVYIKINDVWNLSIFLCWIYFLLELSDILCMLLVLHNSYIWKKRITGSIQFRRMTFRSKQQFNKSVTRFGFFKNHKIFQKLLCTFENLGCFLVQIQNWQQKRATISNFLVFGAAKLMNSCNLSQGCWYKEATLEYHNSGLWDCPTLLFLKMYNILQELIYFGFILALKKAHGIL